MTCIRDITGYETSRDYERLADLMHKQSIVCIVDYGKDCRDVAQTLWTESRSGAGTWQVTVRGVGYIHEFSRSEFIASCHAANLEFLVPTKTTEAA